MSSPHIRSIGVDPFIIDVVLETVRLRCEGWKLRARIEKLQYVVGGLVIAVVVLIGWLSQLLEQLKTCQ